MQRHPLHCLIDGLTSKGYDYSISDKVIVNMNPHHERIKTEDIDQLKKEMRSLDLKTELTKSLAF